MTWMYSTTVYGARLDELLHRIEAILSEIPCVDKVMEIKGIGLITVSGFLEEVGDIKRFDNSKIVAEVSWICNCGRLIWEEQWRKWISYCGRKQLRYVLYEAAISVVGKNAEFREMHEYYRTRKKNPLKKMQSVVAELY